MASYLIIIKFLSQPVLAIFYFEIADYTAFIQKMDLPGCAVIVWIFQTASEEGHCQVFSHNF